MSAAVIIGTIAVLKVVLDTAYLVSVKQQQAQEEASRAPIPVSSAGALPGEALAPLPTLSSTEHLAESEESIGSAERAASSTTTATGIDPKDLFDPAEFLVVAHRRTTRQRDLFDREPAPAVGDSLSAAQTASVMDGMAIPDEPEAWMPRSESIVDLTVEEEIYAQSSTYDDFEPMVH